MDNRQRTVLHHHSEHLSQSEFCALMARNEACQISGLTSDWRAAKEWSLDGQIDISVLEHHFGECIVPVADCLRSEYGAQPKQDMLMKEYLKYWNSYKRPEISEECWSSSTQQERCLYLKDWHMQRDVPEYKAYSIPAYFSSDWLNEYWLSTKGGIDDYRFVYIGPKGSWTPLHCDVFGSFSWSANVAGTKLWILLRPGEEKYFCDVNGKLAYDLTSLDETHYPKLSAYREEIGEPIRVLQNKGDVIFVPSGWHHQVLNLTDTISINHNWFNGFNLGFVYGKLCEAEVEVQKELEFMRGDEDFGAQVEVVLRAHHGMNRQDFQDILHCVVTRRLATPESYPECGRDLEFCMEYLQDPELVERIRVFLNE